MAGHQVYGYVWTEPPRGHLTPDVEAQAPRIVGTCMALYQRFSLQHNLHRRAYRLQEEFQFPLSPDQDKEYELLDKIQIEGTLFAEKRCQKLYVGMVEWSQEKKT